MINSPTSSLFFNSYFSRSFFFSKYFSFTALFISLLIFLSSCENTHNQHIQTNIDLADSLMWTDADSAFLLLYNIHEEPSSEKTRARFALLYAQAHFRTGRLLSNDSLLQSALDFYDNYSDSLSKAWTLYYMGCYQWEHHKIKYASQLFRRAETAGLSTKNNRLLARLYDNWGYMLQGMQPYDDALHLSLKALKYAQSENDSIEIAHILRNIGWSYHLQNKKEEGLNYLYQAVHIAYNLELYALLADIYNKISLVYGTEGEYTQAIQKADLALKYCPQSDSTLQRNVFAQKVYFFKNLHELDSAKVYSEKLDTTSFADKAIYHMELCEIAKMRKDYSSALLHQEAYASNLDSFYNHRIDSELKELQLKYDYSQAQFEKEKMKGIARTRGLYALTSFVLLLLSIMVGLHFYRRNMQRAKVIIQSKEDLLNKALQSLHMKTNDLLRQRQELIEEEHALYKEEKEGANTLLSFSEEQQRIFIAMQTEQEELRKRIFYANEVVKKIERMKRLNSAQKRTKYSEILLSPSERKELYEAVNYSYDNMAEKLHKNYPTLTDDDIFVCCLIRMEVPNADIALLIESSEEALKKRKYRIKNIKLNILDKKQPLDDFLINL